MESPQAIRFSGIAGDYDRRPGVASPSGRSPGMPRSPIISSEDHQRARCSLVRIAARLDHSTIEVTPPRAARSSRPDTRNKHRSTNRAIWRPAGTEGTHLARMATAASVCEETSNCRQDLDGQQPESPASRLSGGERSQSYGDEGLRPWRARLLEHRMAPGDDLESEAVNHDAGAGIACPSLANSPVP